MARTADRERLPEQDQQSRRSAPATNKKRIGNGEPGSQEGQALKSADERWDMRVLAP